MRLLNAHILAVNAARQWHDDTGKPRTFKLCEKKHEWICSNASTSLKNPLLVRVWPMCLSNKLHLCRLLFMQYKITWLVKIQQTCGNTSSLLRFISDIWVNTECKAIFAVASFHNSSAQFAKPAWWCSNSSKFIRSRVNLQVCLIVRFV